MNKHEIDIGNYFKEQLGEFSAAPPKELWNNIQGHSTLTRYNKIQKLKRIGLYTAVSLSAAAIIIVTIVYFAGSQTQELPDNAVTVQEQPTPPPSSDNQTITADTISFIAIENSPVTSTYYPSSSIENNIVEENNPKTATEKQEPEIITKNAVSKQVVSTEKKESKNMPLTILPWLGSAPAELQKEAIIVKESKIGEFIFEEVPFPEYNIELPQPEEEISTESKFLVPNAFTPNGDGVNDQFMAMTADKITEFEMVIYDRNSRLLFHSRDILNGWDGKVNGQIAPIGAYLYIITYKDKVGERHIVKGTVVLYQ